MCIYILMKYINHSPVSWRVKLQIFEKIWKNSGKTWIKWKRKLIFRIPNHESQIGIQHWTLFPCALLELVRNNFLKRWCSAPPEHSPLAPPLHRQFPFQSLGATQSSLIPDPAANSLHLRGATTTTDLNVVASEASAANSLHSGGATNAEPQPKAEARDIWETFFLLKQKMYHLSGPRINYSILRPAGDQAPGGHFALKSLLFGCRLGLGRLVEGGIPRIP